MLGTEQCRLLYIFSGSQYFMSRASLVKRLGDAGGVTLISAGTARSPDTLVEEWSMTLQLTRRHTNFLTPQTQSYLRN